LRHETGELSPGRKADVVLVDLHSQMFTPLTPGDAEHLLSHLVFAANGSCVNTTIIDGVVVLDDRRFTAVDEAEVLAKANESFLRVLDRIR
jgi:5-methylthioadenosine/S-adenosylhomocysteine deaminase